MQVVKSCVLALLKDLILLSEVNLGIALALRFKLVKHPVQFEVNRAGSILELFIQKSTLSDGS